MRRTKRRVLKSKRRVLKSKRRVFRSKRRTTQRKFKYQRGGDPEEELKSQVEEAIQNVENTKSAEKEKSQERNNALYAAYDAKSKSDEQESVVKNLQPSPSPSPSPSSSKGMFSRMFSSAPKNSAPKNKTAEETEAIAELDRLENDTRTMFEKYHQANRDKDRLVVQVKEMKKQALQLLNTFVENFPQNSDVSRYHSLIESYSSDVNKSPNWSQASSRVDNV
jgi:hypothetical protein